ncbi:Glyoxalase-like domain protein [Legionella massiliensis]|uniref:Glyoxalase-like domain protein n=1 Tax=Legionella massiliensis TaxID=1034943 RepID=A0A078KYN4_9GAMM|nr:VOC family protein [Legionella massiliensis]CDZ78182.1 Glyoxalase-like domain protein [Legionella massiliensis]CEE13920.1 Glyoxalase-like domain protein [Legionella massiliensis]
MNYLILYVDNPPNSANFYANLFNIQPVEFSQTFALFVLSPEFKLGLWSKHEVEPAASPVLGGGSELAMQVENDERVRELCDKWRNFGLSIKQEPLKMDFGLNFVVLDPDGHRLRVFARS